MHAMQAFSSACERKKKKMQAQALGGEAKTDQDKTCLTVELKSLESLAAGINSHQVA